MLFFFRRWKEGEMIKEKNLFDEYMWVGCVLFFWFRNEVRVVWILDEGNFCFWRMV